MEITEEVHKYAAEQGVSEHETLPKGMEQTREFTEKGHVLYKGAKCASQHPSLLRLFG